MSAEVPTLEQQLNPLSGVDFVDLEKHLMKPRTMFSGLLSGLVTLMTLFALIPLFSVVWMLLWRGGSKLSLMCFTALPPTPLEQGGGFGNAIVGTLIIVALATAMSVPVGLLSAVFLAQAKSGHRLAEVVRLAAKVLTGFPSILAGVFAYGAIVLLTGGFSAIAGAIALSILMLPTISAHRGRRYPSGTRQNERSGIWHGGHGDPDHLDGAAADSHAGNSHRNHAGRRPGRRGNGSVVVHGAVQQLLARGPWSREPYATDSLAGCADLQLCRQALQEPSRTGLGGGPGIGSAGADHEPDRAKPVARPKPTFIGEQRCKTHRFCGT